MVHTELLFVCGVRWVQFHYWNNDGCLPFSITATNWDNQFIKMKDVFLLSSVYKVIATLLLGLWQDSTLWQAIYGGAQFLPLWVGYERKTRISQSPMTRKPPTDSTKMATKPLAHKPLMDSPDPNWLVEIFVFCRVPLFTFLWSKDTINRTEIPVIGVKVFFVQIVCHKLHVSCPRSIVTAAWHGWGEWVASAMLRAKFY